MFKKQSSRYASPRHQSVLCVAMDVSKIKCILQLFYASYNISLLTFRDDIEGNPSRNPLM